MTVRGVVAIIVLALSAPGGAQDAAFLTGTADVSFARVSRECTVGLSLADGGVIAQSDVACGSLNSFGELEISVPAGSLCGSGVGGQYFALVRLSDPDNGGLPAVDSASGFPAQLGFSARAEFNAGFSNSQACDLPGLRVEATVSVKESWEVSHALGTPARVELEVGPTPTASESASVVLAYGPADGLTTLDLTTVAGESEFSLSDGDTIELRFGKQFLLDGEVANGGRVCCLGTAELGFRLREAPFKVELRDALYSRDLRWVGEGTLFRSDEPRISSDPSVWFSSLFDRRVDTVAADGLTPLLLRIQLPRPDDQVDLQIVESGTPPPGGFQGLPAGYFGCTAMVGACPPPAFRSDQVELPDGRVVAGYVLWAPSFVFPERFETPGDESSQGIAFSRDVAIEVSLRRCPSCASRRIELTVERAPLVFLPGPLMLYADWRTFTWDNFESSGIRPDGSDVGRFTQVRLEGPLAECYLRPTREDGLVAGGERLRFCLLAHLQLLKQERRSQGEEFAVTRADAIAHEVAGLLARISTTDTSGLFPPRGPASQPVIRRLVSVGTPHLNSPIFSLWSATSPFSGVPAYVGDLARGDVQVGSDCIPYLDGSALEGATHDRGFRIHPFSGSGGDDFQQLALLALGPVGAFLEAISILSGVSLTDLLVGEGHDLLSLESSQRAGQIFPFRFTDFGFRGPFAPGTHESMVRDDGLEPITTNPATPYLEGSVGSAVADRFTQEKDFGSSSTFFCPPDLPVSSGATLASMPAATAAAGLPAGFAAALAGAEEGLQLSIETTGPIRVGAPVDVRVEGLGGRVPIRVFFFTESEVFEAPTAPFTATLSTDVVPSGTVLIGAVGTDSSGTLLYATPTRVALHPPSDIAAIEFAEPVLVFRALGEVREPVVLARRADGSTIPVLGAALTTSDSSVLGVVGAGVESRAFGVATLEAQLGSLSTVVTAQVFSDTDRDQDGIADLVDRCVDVASQDQADSDGDGVGDPCDNCRLVPNPDQGDVDSGQDDDATLPGVQQYGDACDADLDNNGSVDATDFFGVLRPCIGADPVQRPECAVADLDGDGVVGPSDFFGVFRPAFGFPPGPGISN